MGHGFELQEHHVGKEIVRYAMILEPGVGGGIVRYAKMLLLERYMHATRFDWKT